MDGRLLRGLWNASMHVALGVIYYLACRALTSFPSDAFFCTGQQLRSCRASYMACTERCQMMQNTRRGCQGLTHQMSGAWFLQTLAGVTAAAPAAVKIASLRLHSSLAYRETEPNPPCECDSSLVAALQTDVVELFGAKVLKSFKHACMRRFTHSFALA